MVGLFEPVCAPWNVGRHPRGVLLRRAPAGLGADGAVPREGHVTRPAHDGGGDPEVLLRPRELHGGPAAGGGRGAGAPELLRGRRSQLHRHPHRRRPGPGPGALDRRGPRRHRHHRLQHRPAAHLPGQPRVPRDAHGGVPGQRLPVPLPDEVHADRSRRQDLGLPRPAGRPARLLPRRQRLGRRRLVRPRGRRARGRGAVLGPAELVPLLGGGAPCRPRGRDRHGHVVHGEVQGPGPRRGPGAQPAVGQRRRRRARRHHLHPVAQRRRPARGRPHRHQARRRQLLGRGLRHGAPARGDPAAAAPRRRRTPSSPTSRRASPS